MLSSSGPSAKELREAMVGRLRGEGAIRSAAVAAVMGEVPRDAFVPGSALAEAYGSGPVVTHRDEAGVAISSASAPGVVATMLEQLDVREGHRVLEIGTGTGYNAALLALLVGSSGFVTSIEFDDDVAGSAREALSRTGYAVELVVGDGALGWDASAPYDRIIVTAGAWDVCDAWREQLVDGGLLLVPLRMAGLTRSVALRRDGEVLRSESLVPCGFIPLRGGDAVSEQNVWVGGKDGDLLLRIDDGAPVDAEAAGRALEYPGAAVWTGVGFVMPEILDFWLARMSGFCRVLISRDAADAGRIASPLFPWGSMGVVSGGTVAYLTVTADFSQIGVAAYGPDSQELAEQVAAQIGAWNADGGPRMTVSVEVHPTGTHPRPDSWLVLEKKDSTVMIAMRGGDLRQ
ncbi:protein-L-isoaspartate(D-aspartate) O-methyltransferase [Sinosporangium album]|uniref:Protein-L-isoaspartate O-methyltransferase n=1 Tax=Sinosporangium album TaxID=504805 RepID=A0A1G8GBJ9_9ACTN|nr:methyltransferase, FxLD system [Sinosporangium album]SDH91706.1 protein-L-isoaspartate(D-aspartate) O-methyltransferase [Sinosporangium album]